MNPSTIKDITARMALTFTNANRARWRTNKIIGVFAKRARCLAGMTRKEFCKESGLTHTQLKELECGRISWDTLIHKWVKGFK